MTPCLLLDMQRGITPVPKIGETKAMVMTSISPPMVGPKLIIPMERTLSVHDDANMHQGNKGIHEWPLRAQR